MPKKFGVNRKKEEARERERKKKNDAMIKKEKAIEDAYWKETDQKIINKKKKEREKEREQREKLRKKQEEKERLEKEEKEIQEKENKYKLKPPTKKEIFQFEEKIKKEIQKRLEEKEKNEIEEIDIEKEFVNENFGKLENKTESGVDIIEATGIDRALEEIKLEEYDKHPEKRMRQAWETFLEKKLPIYKSAYPNLKRSQYVQMVQKEFKTSVDNPVYLNQLQKVKRYEEGQESDK